MWATNFKDKINRLFKTCADWVRRWGGLRPAAPGGPQAQASGLSYDAKRGLVYDPERGVWVGELTYAYRSLNVRLQVEQVEAPPALERLRKAWRSDP